MKKCQCKSQPHYHKDTCEFFDVYGKAKPEVSESEFYNFFEYLRASLNTSEIKIELHLKSKNLSLSDEEVFNLIEGI